MAEDTSGDLSRPDEDLPNPVKRDLEIVGKASLHAAAAIAEFNAIVGYDIRQVMNDDWWKVAIVDGEPQVILNASGARAMAPFAPRPDAAEVVERIIAKVRDAR